MCSPQVMDCFHGLKIIVIILSIIHLKLKVSRVAFHSLSRHGSPWHWVFLKSAWLTGKNSQGREGDPASGTGERNNGDHINHYSRKQKRFCSGQSFPCGTIVSPRKRLHCPLGAGAESAASLSSCFIRLSCKTLARHLTQAGPLGPRAWMHCPRICELFSFVFQNPQRLHIPASIAYICL